MLIQQIDAIQLLDSRAFPTIEAIVTLDNGIAATAMVPSGASTGTYEAHELRDRGKSYRGKSVEKAIDNIRNEISNALGGMPATAQKQIDEAMIQLDGTLNKSRLGANAILAVSMAVARAASQATGKPLYAYLSQDHRYSLPLPEIQIIGGGKHGNNALDIQDILIVCPQAGSLQEVFEMTFDVYYAVAELLKMRGLYSGMADEGGFYPRFRSHAEAIETVIEGISNAGYKVGGQIVLSLDVAANNLYRDGQYHFPLEGVQYAPEEFRSLMARWCRDYPIRFLEDPLHEDDWKGWNMLKSELDPNLKLIGDDLFVTNKQRIRRGAESESANACLIKPNQIGTITETLESIALVQELGWQPIVSARSGETEDPFITHLAVGTNTGMIKVGSLPTCARTTKWNELLRISRQVETMAWTAK
jgi:enolase